MDYSGFLTQAEVPYLVFGVEEELAALNAVREASPENLENLTRQTLEISERINQDIFKVLVTYEMDVFRRKQWRQRTGTEFCIRYRRRKQTCQSEHCDGIQNSVGRPGLRRRDQRGFGRQCERDRHHDARHELLGNSLFPGFEGDYRLQETPRGTDRNRKQRTENSKGMLPAKSFSSVRAEAVAGNIPMMTGKSPSGSRSRRTGKI